MKRLTIIVGAGGTGSYLLPNLLAFYNGLAGNIENKVVLIDGDVVEDKNLLRQGFLQDDLNQPKSDALVSTYKQAYDIEVESKNVFLNNADMLLSIVKDNIEDLEDIVLISCVDNNYARLRMVVGQQLIKQFYPDIEVTFVDSGNEEWHGQSIITTMDNFTESILKYENGVMSVQPEKYTEVASYDSIFVRMANWENFLTKGDHEISCDIVTVSHPQNVATNMTAASLIISSLGRLARGLEPKNISFNARNNKFELYDLSEKEEYLRSMNEIAEFINNDLEFSVIGKVFSTMNGGSKKVSSANRESFTIENNILDVINEQVVSEITMEDSTSPIENSTTELEVDFSYLMDDEPSFIDDETFEVSIDHETVIPLSEDIEVTELSSVDITSVNFKYLLSDDEMTELAEEPSYAVEEELESYTDVDFTAFLTI